MVLLLGDCKVRMAEMAPESIDHLCCDPPYGLNFMGKAFDDLGSGNAQRLWHREWLHDAFRVLKSGGQIQAFGGSRVFHHLALAMEDVGFHQLRLEGWVYASGFPKSHNIAKALKDPEGAWAGWAQPSSQHVNLS